MLHHDSDTISEITRAVNAGKDVTTHTDAVSIPGGWSGFGYIITDPIVGDGVYKISGGLNGSVTIDGEEPVKSLLVALADNLIGKPLLGILDTITSLFTNFKKINEQCNGLDFFAAYALVAILILTVFAVSFFFPLLLSVIVGILTSIAINQVAYYSGRLCKLVVLIRNRDNYV